MTNSQGRESFLKSEQGIKLREELQKMVSSADFNTKAMYTLVENDGGDHFVEKHMRYMSTHPTMDHWQYVMNIKLMTRIK